MEEEIKKKIFRELIEAYFMECDRFFVRKWSTEDVIPDAIPDRVRKEAYRCFYKKAGKSNIASRQTIQKWFGIKGRTLPKREQILHLALIFGMTTEETSEYLKYAISEPGFQVNDYREMIIYYCLENQLSYDVYKDMVEYFEEYSDWSVVIRQTAHTDEILRSYDSMRNLKPKEFLVWMRRNEDLFKGYSMTTYQHFSSLVEETLTIFREEIRELLFITLEDTGFFRWAWENGIEEREYGREIRHFLKNRQRHKNDALSKEKVREIQQLTSMAYSPLRRVCDLLTEIYDGIQIENTELNTKVKDTLKKEIGYVDAKYLSEIMTMSMQKEREMNLRKAYTKCLAFDEKSSCPEEVRKLLMKEKKSHIKSVETVEAAKREIHKLLKRQKQRTHNIRRSDLLILIQYVSQKRYLRKIGRAGTDYEEERAKDEFVKMADTILSMCGMRPIDDTYQLDYLILQCFGQEDIYLLSEILEGTK